MPRCCSEDMYSLAEEKQMCSYAARWRRGARRKAQSRGGGEGGMGTGQGLRPGHEGVWEHRRNADLWSQCTRTSGQEESISNDTHPTHSSKYVLPEGTPARAKHRECKNEQRSTLKRFKMPRSKL